MPDYQYHYGGHGDIILQREDVIINMGYHYDLGILGLLWLSQAQVMRKDLFGDARLSPFIEQSEVSFDSDREKELKEIANAASEIAIYLPLSVEEFNLRLCREGYFLSHFNDGSFRLMYDFILNNDGRLRLIRKRKDSDKPETEVLTIPSDDYGILAVKYVDFVKGEVRMGQYRDLVSELIRKLSDLDIEKYLRRF